jgi:type IV fimbrial biogenesis protein FimT
MVSHKGFTLIELMVVLLIASILLGVAIPSFVDMSVRNRLVTTSNDFVSTINLARSESIRRSATVTVCGSDDGANCDADAWSSGWIVFADVNGDGVKDPADTIVRAHEGLGNGYTLNADPAFASSITYGADGSADGTGVFAVCHDDELDGARAVIVTPLRPRVIRDTDNNRIPNIDADTDIAGCTDPSGT